MELWFSRQPILGTKGNSFGPITKDQITLLYSTPRCLVVRLAHVCLDVVFVCIHAPHQGSPDKDKWWADFDVQVHRWGMQHDLVIMGDFNVRFHAPIEGHKVWIPSTYAGIHVGVHATWYGGRGEAPARLDYVAIPVAWHVPDAGSYVVQDLDMANKAPDHMAVALHVVTSRGKQKQKRRGGPHIDTESMSTPQGQKILEDIADSLALHPWDMDAHEHCHRLNSELVQKLTVAFPKARNAPRAGYITEETWQLRNTRVALQRSARRRRTFMSLSGARLALLAWKRGCSLSSTWVWYISRLLQNIPLCQQDQHQLRDSFGQLRAALRRDKSLLVQTLARDANAMTSGAVFKRLRSLLRFGGTRRKSQTSPAVRFKDGRLAADGDERLQAWIEHFSEMERGHISSPEELLAECWQFQARQTSDFPEILPEDVISRSAMEASFRGTKPGK